MEATEIEEQKGRLRWSAAAVSATEMGISGTASTGSKMRSGASGRRKKKNPGGGTRTAGRRSA